MTPAGAPLGTRAGSLEAIPEHTLRDDDGQRQVLRGEASLPALGARANGIACPASILMGSASLELASGPPHLPLDRVEEEADQPVKGVLVVPTLSRDPHSGSSKNSSKKFEKRPAKADSLVA